MYGEEKESRMQLLKKKLKNLFLPKVILNESAKKVFSATKEFKDLGLHRFHLRILNDGRGILIVDSQFIVYLNHTAMIYMQLYIEGKTIVEIQNFFIEYFHTDPIEVKEDFESILDKIAVLMQMEDGTPVNEIGFKIKNREINEFPMRADFALTYRYDGQNQSYQARSAGMKELDMESAKKVMDTLWDLGVPNIFFSGGEPSERDDLMELIAYSEEKGFITGLATNGSHFAKESAAVDAINQGLDYVEITIHSHDENIHNRMTKSNNWIKAVDSIKNFEKEDIYFMTRTTLTKYNMQNVQQTIRFLHDELKVQVMAFNALINYQDGTEYKYGIPQHVLEDLLDDLYSLADELGITIKFYSPNQHLVTNPIEVGYGPKRGSAALTSIAIEPNGDVIPSQAYFQSVGNILNDSWDKIWQSKLFKIIRKARYTEPNAKEDDLLTICGGGTPLHLD